MKQTIDKDWFFEQLANTGKSLRGLARHMDLDASAVSRMLAGARNMKLEEATSISMFLGVPVADVLGHAGINIDQEPPSEQIFLSGVIDERGRINKINSPKPLQQKIINRAQDATRASNSKIVAAQIVAGSGALAIWDDAVIFYEATDGIEPSSIGQISVCLLENGEQIIARVERARKTGEAVLRMVDNTTEELSLLSSSPVFIIIP